MRKKIADAHNIARYCASQRSLAKHDGLALAQFRKKQNMANEPATLSNHQRGIWNCGRLLNELVHWEQKAWVIDRQFAFQPPYAARTLEILEALSCQFLAVVSDENDRKEVTATLEQLIQQCREPSVPQILAESSASDWANLEQQCQAAADDIDNEFVPRAAARVRNAIDRHLGEQGWGVPSLVLALKQHLGDPKTVEARLFATATALDQLLHPVPITNGMDWNGRPDPVESGASPLIPPCVTGDFGAQQLSAQDRDRILARMEDLDLGEELKAQVGGLGTDPTRRAFVFLVENRVLGARPSMTATEPDDARYVAAAAAYEYAVSRMTESNLDNTNPAYKQVYAYLRQHGGPEGYTLPAEFNTWKTYASKGGAKQAPPKGSG